MQRFLPFLSLKSNEELEIYKKEIFSKLDKRAKIITDLIPESEYILEDNLKELDELPTEADEQKRFTSTL